MNKKQSELSKEEAKKAINDMLNIIDGTTEEESKNYEKYRRRRIVEFGIIALFFMFLIAFIEVCPFLGIGNAQKLGNYQLWFALMSAPIYYVGSHIDSKALKQGAIIIVILAIVARFFINF